MDRLTPEEFEELFNAYNSGFTEDILNSPDRFDKLKDINKETAKAIANKRAEQLKQAGLTPNLDAFMPESYNRWYRPFDLDDRDTIMDTLNYANMLSGGKGFSKDSLEDFSKFIQKLYYTKSIKKKYSNATKWKFGMVLQLIERAKSFNDFYGFLQAKVAVLYCKSHKYKL